MDQKSLQKIVINIHSNYIVKHLYIYFKTDYIYTMWQGLFL